MSFICLRESVGSGRESKPTVLQLILTGLEREREKYSFATIAPYHKNAFLENFDLDK